MKTREEKTEYQRQWYAANRERLLAEAAEQRAANPEATKARYKKQYQAYKEQSKITNKKWYQSLRPKVIAGYGGACACCGETTYEFLALDHVNGGGRQHTKENHHNHYSDALRRNFPPDYQILCHNCNSAKGFYGQCPHQRQQLTPAQVAAAEAVKREYS